VCLREMLTGYMQRRVFASACAWLGDPIEAEDLAQEAFPSFSEKSKLRGESAFSSLAAPAHCQRGSDDFRKKKAVVASSMNHANQRRDSVLRWEIGGPD